MVLMRRKKICKEVGWKDLPEDILVMIFNRLDRKCLFETAYCVCRWWRSVSRLLVFWKKRNGVVNLTFKDIGVGEGHQFMKLLKSILDGLEHKFETVTHLCFPKHLYLSDDHLYYIAQRSPQLQNLWLPCTNNMITRVGFSKAIPYWREIRSLTTGPIKFSDYISIIEEIGISWKNMESLMIYKRDMKPGAKESKEFVLDEYTSLLIVNNLPKLKYLVFEGCVLYQLGIKNIMSKCTGVEGIVFVDCQLAMSLKYLCSPGNYKSYSITKHITKDNAVEWSTTLSFGFRYSTLSILDFLW